ncbi:MAG: glycoside hydrolase domain-containing protein, partial [Ginsengibacter sp.]
EVIELKSASGKSIPLKNIQANFVRYVITDHLGDLKSGCGIPKNLPTSLHADMIDNIKSFSINAQESRPIWLSVDVPADAKPGIYKGSLSINGDRYKANHAFTIEVVNHILPPAKDWTFHLDLWQNPYSDARVNGVPLWSPEHFKAMKPVYKMLAEAGQKVITATLIHDPWSSQTYDVYGGMVKWTKRKDGSWNYDYTIFDQWVKFMMDLGIDKQINCYSMIPWTFKFSYADEASGKEMHLEAKPGSKEYIEHWLPMLTDFARHLKEKNWFGKTTIAMDERPEKDMKIALEIIKAADPDFKVSLAGNYHPEIQALIDDYCIAPYQNISAETLTQRKEKGLITTYYTACPEPFPNAFTSSEYAELTWLPLHVLYRNFDGYLRWDYNNWNADPLVDSRFGSWAAGDTYFVYPEGRSSIRFERLREGIQEYEKIIILKKLFTERGEEEKLKKLNFAISQFGLETLNGKNAHVAVDHLKEILFSF